MASRLYDLDQAAALLATSKRSIYRLIASGDLASCDIAPPGSKQPKTRVSDDAISAFIKARTRKSPQTRTSA